MQRFFEWMVLWDYMFENRSKKQRIIIYLIISGVVTLILALFHLYQGWILIYALLAAIIEFFCIFYILYLPLKVKG